MNPDSVLGTQLNVEGCMDQHFELWWGCGCSYHDQHGRQGWLTLKGTAVAVPGSAKADGTEDVAFTTQRIEIMTYNEPLAVDRARPVVLVRTREGTGWQLEG
jgi:hypothetical protein